MFLPVCKVIAESDCYVVRAGGEGAGLAFDGDLGSGALGHGDVGGDAAPFFDEGDGDGAVVGLD